MVQTPKLEAFAVEGRIEMANIWAQPDWLQKLKEAQRTDKELQQLQKRALERQKDDFQCDKDSLLCFQGRSCVLDQEEI
jgi:hypothetical protein